MEFLNNLELFLKNLGLKKGEDQPRDILQKKAVDIVIGIIDGALYRRPQFIEELLREIDKDTGLEKRVLLAKARDSLKLGEQAASGGIKILVEEEAFRDRQKRDLCFIATGSGEPSIIFNPHHPIWKREKIENGEGGSIEVKKNEALKIINSLLEAQAMIEKGLS